MIHIKMASYKATLKASIKAYPRLFLDEVDYLHQAFFVLGNGLHWTNGELTDGRPLKAMIAEAEKNRESTNKIGSDTYEFMFEEDNFPHEPYVYETGDLEVDQKKELNHRLSMIEEGFDDCWYKNEDDSIGHKIYPISQFCKIMNLPDDIKPDWLAAAEKVVALCYTQTFKLTENDWKCIKEVVEPRIKELKMLKTGSNYKVLKRAIFASVEATKIVHKLPIGTIFLVLQYKDSFRSFGTISNEYKIFWNNTVGVIDKMEDEEKINLEEIKC